VKLFDTHDGTAQRRSTKSPVLGALPIGSRSRLQPHSSTANMECPSSSAVARSERFELPTLGIEIRYSIHIIKDLARSLASTSYVKIKDLARFWQPFR
jgi:hypothetical protein